MPPSCKKSEAAGGRSGIIAKTSITELLDELGAVVQQVADLAARDSRTEEEEEARTRLDFVFVICTSFGLMSRLSTSISTIQLLNVSSSVTSSLSLIHLGLRKYSRPLLNRREAQPPSDDELGFR